jgi:hypothetical protein
MNVEHTPHQPLPDQSNSVADAQPTPEAVIVAGDASFVEHADAGEVPAPPPIVGKPPQTALPTFSPKVTVTEPPVEPLTPEAEGANHALPPKKAPRKRGFLAGLFQKNPLEMKRSKHRRYTASDVSLEEEASTPLPMDSEVQGIPLPEEPPQSSPIPTIKKNPKPMKPPTPAQYAKTRRRLRQFAVWKVRWVEVARLALLLGLFYGIYTWVAQPVWYLKSNQLQFENNRMVQTTQLQSRMTPYMGKHLLLLNPAEISQHLRADNQLLANVQVKRQLWPEAKLIIRLSEHRLWGLVHDPWEKPRILAWHKSTKHTPESLIPPPYAFVVGNYENRRFASSGYRLPKQALSTPYTLMFVDTKWYRAMKQESRKQLLGDVDRIVHGLIAMPDIKVSSVSIDKARNLDVDITYHNHPLLVKAGVMDPTIFKRLARIKPTLHVVDKLNTAVPDSFIDRIDARWSENVYLHRKNGETHTSQPEVEELPPRA